MAIKRVERQSLLGPVRVNKSSAGGSPIGDAVVNLANSMRNRHFEIAAAEAEESGKLTAAQADLTSITNFDNGTGKPQILNQVAGMGRIQEGAFEDAVYVRFTNTMDSVINNKANEIAVSLENEKNAPELFTQQFKNYLDGLGSDAKGFYKQFIVDRGGNYLENMRSQLEIARTRRVYKETLDHKNEIKSKSLERGYNLGFSGDYAQISKDIDKLIFDFSVFDKVGGLTKNEQNEHLANFRQKVAQGKIAALLQEPAIAMHAADIHQYFESMGNQSILQTLPNNVRDAVKEIKNIIGPKNPTELSKFAAANKVSFDNAAESGSIIRTYQQNRIERIKEAMQKIEGERKTAKQVRIDNATTTIVSNIESDRYRNFGAGGSITKITEQIQHLNILANTLGSSNAFDKERHKALENQVEAAKDQIAEGLVQRMMDTPEGKQNAETIAAIFESGNFEKIYQYMPTLQYNLFRQVADSDNFKAFQNIATGTKKQEKIKLDKQKIRIDLDLDNDLLTFEEFVKNPNTTYVQQEMAEIALGRKYENINMPEITKKINAAIKANITNKNEQLEAENLEQFAVQADQILASTTTDNFLDQIDNVLNIGKTLKVDNEQIEKSIQPIFNKAAEDRIRIALTGRATEENIIFLNALAGLANPDSQTISPLISPELRKEINGLLNYKETINGKVYSVDKKTMYDMVTSTLTRVTKVLETEKKAQKTQTIRTNLSNGTFMPNMYNEEGQKILKTELEKLTGPIDPRIYTFSSEDIQNMPDVLREQTLQQLNLLKNSGNLTAEFNSAFFDLENGNLRVPQIEAYMRNVRELGLADTASAKINMNQAVYATLGRDGAARLTAYYKLYTFFPETNRNTMLSDVIDKNNKEGRITLEDFKRETEYSSARELIDDIATIPDEIISEFTTVAELLARTYGKGTKNVIENMIESRFVTNQANLYSPITGSSLAPNDFGSTDEQIAPYLFAVKMKVAALNQADPDSLYYFNENTNVRVEDIAAGQSIFVLQGVKDLVGNETEDVNRIAAGQRRVIFGPTLQSSPANPEGQLYAIVSETGAVQPIPNTVFSLETDWIKKGFEEYSKFKAVDAAERAEIFKNYLGATYDTEITGGLFR